MVSCSHCSRPPGMASKAALQSWAAWEARKPARPRRCQGVKERMRIAEKDEINRIFHEDFNGYVIAMFNANLIAIADGISSAIIEIYHSTQ